MATCKKSKCAAQKGGKTALPAKSAGKVKRQSIDGGKKCK